jgi:hypothetical protein
MKTPRLAAHLAAVSLAAVLLVSSGSFADAAAINPIAISSFNSKTGLSASEADVQSVWNALQSMGTTNYIGGTIGNFKIDESSLIAGALSIGVTELNNFLSTGSLSIGSSGVGSLLSSAMSGAAGIDMSYLTGSFTSGGGSLNGLPFATTSSLSSSTGGALAAGQCDPSIASKQVAVGLKGVDNIVNAAQSDQYGFSRMGALGSSTSGGNFASMGCLDKLFQNAGSDILFKPPSLGSLTSMLSGWACDKAKSVTDQIGGQFGDMSQFDTTAMGGFFPSGVFGEANDGTTPVRPGIGNQLSEVFGDTFSDTTAKSDSSLSTIASIFK